MAYAKAERKIGKGSERYEAEVTDQFLAYLRREIQNGNVRIGYRTVEGEGYRYRFSNTQDTEVLEITAGAKDPSIEVLNSLSINQPIRIKYRNQVRLRDRLPFKIVKGALAAGAVTAVLIGATLNAVHFVGQASERSWNADTQQGQQHIEEVDQMAIERGNIPLSESIQEAEENDRGRSR